MKKSIFLLLMLFSFVSQSYAKDCTQELPGNSLIGEYQAAIPCNAAGFGSNAATLSGIIPPDQPLKIVLEANFPSEVIKEAVEEHWEKGLDTHLFNLSEMPELYRCAYLCYNLGVSIEIDYVSLIDGGVCRSIITPKQLEITFNKKND